MNPNKLVCGCCNVTIGDIERAVLDGAESFEDVMETTGASTCCGKCRSYAENVYEDIAGEGSIAR